jgi:GT2 family glycosyltransferase
MNRLYVEYLKKYTTNPFELIIIDNASADGSREFFQQEGATVIVNPHNYSYPHCQNQGIERAKFDKLAFFNNDLLVSPGWDKQLLKIMAEKNLDIISAATNDRVENDQATFRLRRKWEWIKKPLKILTGTSYSSLKWMHKMMYGDWERWTMNRREQFGDSTMEGFSGSCILSTRSAIEKIGRWDERIQSADFDIYLRSKKRSVEYGDIKPLSIALGVYFHHYGRLSVKKKNYTPFIDKTKLISLEEKWGSEMEALLADISR